MAPRFLGLEIGGTKLQVVAGEAAGSILARQRIEIAREAGALAIRSQLAGLIPQLAEEFAPRAVGIGFGGPVDRCSGTICCSHHVEGWNGFGMCEWVRSLAEAPTVLENDANVACLGEARVGAGVGFDPVLYVTLGSGIGGGLVVGGSIYHGLPPGELEIGHVRLDRSGATVESRCSGWAMDARIREQIRAEPQSVLARLASGSSKGEARFLAPALAQGCHAAATLLDGWAEDLAFGLSHAVHLLHPEIVVLGGGLSLVGASLSERVEARLTGYLMEAFRPGPAVKIAGLGEDAVPSGALILAAESVR